VFEKHRTDFIPNLWDEYEGIERISDSFLIGGERGIRPAYAGCPDKPDKLIVYS